MSPYRNYPDDIETLLDARRGYWLGVTGIGVCALTLALLILIF